MQPKKKTDKSDDEVEFNMKEPENEPISYKTPDKVEQKHEESEDLQDIENGHLKIKVHQTITLKNIHEHELQYVADMGKLQDGDNEWCCNGVEIFKDGCKSGQTDIGEHLGIKAWRSTGEDADFDLCETCI